MASSRVPPEVGVEIYQGLWQPFRWFGAEPMPMLMLVGIEFLGIVMRTVLSVIVATIIVAVWAAILRMTYERDPMFMESRRRYLWYMALKSMRGIALVSSLRQPFNPPPFR